jgi:hypothetical protein
VGQFDGLASHQRLELARQGLQGGHGRAVEQDRHDPDIPCQGGTGLQADEVVRIIQPPAPGGVGDVEPFVADQDDQHPARGDGLFDRDDEISAGLDALHIHEHPVGAEVGHQPVVQAAGIAGGVVAAIADENAIHGLGILMTR